MKPKNLIRPFLACTIFGAQVAVISAQTSNNFPNGITFDGSGDTPGSTSLSTWGGSNARSIGLAAETGMVMLYSPIDGTAPYFADSGVWLQGNPVTVMLSSSNPSSPYNGNFNVTREYTWSATPPLLNINGQTGNTTFTNSNVIITGGTLTVGGSPVITSASAPTVLTAGGFVNTSNFNSTLSAATPPTSSAWTAAFVPRGNVAPVSGSEGGLLALGTATASGSRSLASGYGSVASGMLSIALGTTSAASTAFATAIGQNATASGQFSLAVGNGVSATGTNSIALGASSSSTGTHTQALGSNCNASTAFSLARGNAATASGYASNAMGWGVSAKARSETAVGQYNIESVVTSGTTDNGLYGVLRVGNGTGSGARSDALTVLMGGQTTLTNKEWKAAVMAAPGNAATALADPASTTDSSGNALVVDGHAVLNGKVTLAVAQGDISMGDYQ